MGRHQYRGVYENGRGVPALLVDLLETDFGRWHTVDELIGMVHLRRPEYGDNVDRVANTVRRAAHRLANKGTIEVRSRVDFRSVQHVNEYRLPWRDYWEQETV